MDREMLINQFKDFVSRNPYLNEAVQNKQATWQELYELWFMNGENSSAFDRYKTTTIVLEEKEEAKSSTLGFMDVIQFFRKMDPNAVQKNLKQLEKAIGILQSFTSDDKRVPQDIYQQRPLYRRYED